MSLKPGDLAYIVNAVVPINNGRPVEILQFIGYKTKGEEFTAPDGRLSIATKGGNQWWVRSKTGLHIKYPDGRVEIKEYNHAGENQLRKFSDPEGSDKMVTEKEKEVI